MVDNYAKDKLIPSLKESLVKLRTDDVDLTLIHWPAPDNGVSLEEFMMALAEAKAQGFTRQIGISNFNIDLTRQAIAMAGKEAIATNQIELSPYLQNTKLAAFLKERGIPVTSYMTLAYGKVLKDSIIRLSHTSLLDGKAPVSSSAIQAEGVNVFVDDNGGGAGFAQASMPRALEVDEIHDIVKQFRQATRNAMDAGFDGVELHAANGYLVNQFLDSHANSRTDQYVGWLENRIRLLDEVAHGLLEGTGDSNRVGIRLASLTTLNGCVDADPETTHTAAAKRLGEIGVGYIHIAEADWDDAPYTPVSFKHKLREVFPGTMIYAGKYNAERVRQVLTACWPPY